MSPVNVRIFPAPAPAGSPSIIRVQTSDLEVVAEGHPGGALAIGPGKYMAYEVDARGQQASRIVRFDVDEEMQDLQLHLEALPTHGPHEKSGAVQGDNPAFTAEPSLAPPFSFALVLRSGAQDDELADLAGDKVLNIRDMHSGSLDAVLDELPRVAPAAQAIGLLFDGRRGRRLALYPFAIKPAWHQLRPAIQWSSARTDGFAMPSFAFGDPDLDQLATGLRSRVQPIAPAPGSLPAGLAGVIQSLGMLEDSRSLPWLERETQDWPKMLGEIPDARIVRAEVLARMGKHLAAREALGQMPYFHVVPWTRKALQLLAARLDFYGRDAGGEGSLRYHRRWYRELLAKCHPASGFAIFELGSREP